MKKKNLFVIDSLNIGGAEKSLVTLLNLIDFVKYEVHLQMFAMGGVFEMFIPKEVNILPCIKGKSIIRHLVFSLLIRLKKYKHAEIARIYWKTIGTKLPVDKTYYDVSIGYGQCLPTFFVVDKTMARKKIAWVNCMYHLSGCEKNYQQRFYEKLDGISLVSPEALKHFQGVYPEFSRKMHLIKDLYDGDMIERMSCLKAEQEINHALPVIMTAGRLNKSQKAYDLALQAANILRERGVKFRWYVIGEGPYRGEMENYISENHLEDIFILLGATPNPYAYMRQCDIYVQTSRFEGFGLTVAEARILNRPIVCTNFDACHMQLIDGKNALIASFEPSDIADKIELLMNDKSLYNSIQQYQMAEKKGNVEDIEDFYELIK